jgi:hypothetical protein
MEAGSEAARISPEHCETRFAVHAKPYKGSGSSGHDESTFEPSDCSAFVDCKTVPVRCNRRGPTEMLTLDLSGCRDTRDDVFLTFS